jgi:hypothetical protein
MSAGSDHGTFVLRPVHSLPRPDIPSHMVTDWDAWFTELGDVFRNCTGCEAIMLVIDFIMSNNVGNWLDSIFQPDYTCFTVTKIFFSNVWKNLQLRTTKLFMDEYNITLTTKNDQVFIQK